MTEPRSGHATAIAFLLLLSIVAGGFGEVYVPAQMAAADAAATAQRLRDDSLLFRLGFAAYLTEAVSDVVLAWLFYVVLRPVNRDLALLSAFFGLVAMLTFATTKLLYFGAPLVLQDQGLLAGIATDQREALAALLVALYGGTSGVSMLFYGIAWMLRGGIAFGSTILPRAISALMVAAGAGFVAKALTLVLAPGWSTPLLIAPMALASLVLAGWLLTRGLGPAAPGPGRGTAH